MKAYGDGVRAYLAWCERAGRPPAMDRRQLREFVHELLTWRRRAKDRISSSTSPGSWFSSQLVSSLALSAP